MDVIARLANLPGALPGACAQGLIWGIMAIGVYLTYRILDVADLTVDGSFGTGGAVCVMCLLSGQNVWVSLFMALLAGLLAGLVTGILHTFMGIPAILAGILTQLSLYSINLKIMGKANQAINVDKYSLLISLRWVKEFALHNPIIMVIIVTAALIGILYWFFGTELGCAIRATGSNPAMSRAQGINTNFNIVLGLAVSNGLVALSGALLSQYQGFADVGMGRGAIVIGLAAVIIGEALFSRIFHNFALKMAAVSLGAIIYYIVIQLVLTLGFDANLLKLLSASVVAIFLAVPYWKGKYFSKPVKKAKEDAKKLQFAAVVSSAVMAGLMIAFSGLFPLFYDTTETVRHTASALIIVAACVMPISAYNNACYFTIRSGGKTLITFLFDCCFVWVVTVPAATLLVRKTDWSVVWVYAGCMALEVLKSVAGSILVRSGKWAQNLALASTEKAVKNTDV